MNWELVKNLYEEFSSYSEELNHVEKLEEIAKEKRDEAFTARRKLCQNCPHPIELALEHKDCRVCSLCGLLEYRGDYGYSILDWEEETPARTENFLLISMSKKIIAGGSFFEETNASKS